MSNFIGVKYDSDRDIAAIAKLVRKDIKTAVKAGALPKGLKASIRISRYSMGQSLNITITACPSITETPGLTILNHRRLLLDAQHPHRGHHDMPIEYVRIFSDESIAITKTIEGIALVYGYDRSEPMTDYYNSAFNLDVKFDYALEREERTAFDEEHRCVMAEVAEPPEPKTGEKRPGQILKFFPVPGAPGLN